MQINLYRIHIRYYLWKKIYIRIKYSNRIVRFNITKTGLKLEYNSLMVSKRNNEWSCCHKKLQVGVLKEVPTAYIFCPLSVLNETINYTRLEIYGAFAMK